MCFFFWIFFLPPVSHFFNFSFHLSPFSLGFLPPDHFPAETQRREGGAQNQSTKNHLPKLKAGRAPGSGCAESLCICNSREQPRKGRGKAERRQDKQPPRAAICRKAGGDFRVSTDSGGCELEAHRARLLSHLVPRQNIAPLLSPRTWDKSIAPPAVLQSQGVENAVSIRNLDSGLVLGHFTSPRLSCSPLHASVLHSATVHLRPHLCPPGTAAAVRTIRCRVPVTGTGLMKATPTAAVKCQNLESEQFITGILIILLESAAINGLLDWVNLLPFYKSKAPSKNVIFRLAWSCHNRHEILSYSPVK